MAWTTREPYIIPQGIADLSTTARMPLGTLVKAEDPTYGFGHFKYVKGVASCAAKDWLTLQDDDGVSVRLVANAIGPVGVAMAALTASYYGFVQVFGKALGACLTSFADNGRCYITGTAGSVDDTSVAGDVVWNAKGASTTTAATGFAEFELNYPFTADRVSIIS